MHQDPLVISLSATQTTLRRTDRKILGFSAALFELYIYPFHYFHSTCRNEFYICAIMHASTLNCRQTRSENSDLEKERRRAKRILGHILSICSIAAHFPLHSTEEVQLTKQNTGLGGAKAMGRECLHMAGDWCAMLEVWLAVLMISEYLALRRNFLQQRQRLPVHVHPTAGFSL